MNAADFRPNRCNRVAAALLLSCLNFGPLRATVRLPAVFSDHLVLQRSRAVPVWGWADPGERVAVSLAGETAGAVAGPAGRWRATLPPLKPAEEGLELTVSASNRITVHDVVIGDVWLCSGQSNMELPLEQTEGAPQEIARSSQPRLRFFVVEKRIANQPAEDCVGRWERCDPHSAAGFSAAAYYFGKEILAAEKIPVGLLAPYWGGTPAEAWTSREALAADPALTHYARKFQEHVATLPQLKQDYAQHTMPGWQKAYATWRQVHGAAYDVAWKEYTSIPLDRRPTPYLMPFSPKPPAKPAAPDHDPRVPTVLFNGMIHPLVPFALTGAIWYQGEANANKAREYETLFPAMIADWRRRWGEGNFPFLWVQLAGYGRGGGHWAELRAAQTKTLALPNTGMAVAIDIGSRDDIHPKNKAAVGHRLALAARQVAYHESVPASGPVFASCRLENHVLRVQFTNADGGLKAEAPPGSLGGFEVAGTDRRFVPAEAAIQGDAVLVRAAAVPRPAAVRYAWADYYEPAPNLYNGAGLPTAPFSAAPEP